MADLAARANFHLQPLAKLMVKKKKRKIIYTHMDDHIK